MTFVKKYLFRPFVEQAQTFNYVLLFESSGNFVSDTCVRSIIENYQVEQWMFDYAKANDEYNQGFQVDDIWFNMKVYPKANQ